MSEVLIETAFPALTLLEDEAPDRPLRVKGIASVVDTVNGNRRVYPRAVMEREIARIAPLLDQSDHAGAVDHPYSAPSVSDLGLKFTDLYMEGNDVWFEAEIIPTQRGKDLEAVIRAGVRIGISSRGYGSATTEERNGQKVSVIGDDFVLESYDAVVTPSVGHARILQYEAAVRDAIGRLIERELAEETWDSAYVTGLPDSSFAYIGKDGQRHLPYKDKDGKPDAAHVRNALARLSQTDIPASAKASARAKLAKAAKALGIEVAGEGLEPEKTPVEPITSVQGPGNQPAPANGEHMETDNTVDLIQRAAEMERRLKAEAGIAEAEVEAEVEVEAVIVEDEDTAVEEVVEAAEETAVEATVEDVELIIVDDEAPAESAEVVAEEREVEAGRVDEALVELTRRAEAAELQVARLEADLTAARTVTARVHEDANIQAAIQAVATALAAELAEGDWDILASLANVNSTLDWINHRDDYAEGEHDPAECPFCGAYDHLTTPRAKVAFEKATAPILTLAARIERDRAIVKATEGERYGRRMLDILRESAQAPADVARLLPEARAQALSEATGRRVIAETRGVLSTADKRELTPEQREYRRLAGYVD